MRDGIRKGLCLFFALCLLGAGCVPAALADDLTLTEAYFAQREGYSGIVEVPGKGPMRYYAQNDPLWIDFAYEQSTTPTRRPFGDGGCGPTAGAMAIVNLVPEANLPQIARFAKKEYSLCPCSITREKCIHSFHSRYVLTSARDFLRFFPLVMGDFAMGNNVFGVSGRNAAQGTNTGFLYQVASVYRLDVAATTSLTEALAALNGGATVIGHASRGGAFTNTGHYVLIAHADAEKMYILDPLARTVYKTNQADKLEILQPGLVAVTHADYAAAGIGSYLIFSRR